MARVSLKIGNMPINPLKAGDLFKLADPRQGAIAFQMANLGLAAAHGKPISELANTELQTGLTVAQDSKWKLGGSAGVTFGFDAGGDGVVSIKREGELLRHRLGERGEDETSVEVPAGHAYVSVKLNVAIGLKGGLAYSGGNIGVSGNASVNDRFLIANHKLVTLDTVVGDALVQSLERFELPFKPDGVEALADGDYLEYEFLGKLALGFGITYGVSGLFFGGRSNGEIARSFNSDIGKAVVKLKPSFKARAGFSVGYEHEDAFRMVVGRRIKPDDGINTATLSIFKMDASKLSVQLQGTIEAHAGASTQFDLELDKVIGEAAGKLVEGLPDGPGKQAVIGAFRDGLQRESNRRQLQKYVRDANARVNKLLRDAGGRKAELTLLHERINSDTSLFNYEFDLNQPDALSQGYRLAVEGDYFEAIKADGVSLLPGSFVESEVIRRTSISLQLFDLYRAASITEYFKKTSIVYTGECVFRLRYTTGVKRESGRVGHAKLLEVFFTADVLTKDFANVDDLDVKMHFVLNDRANARAARETARALERIGSGSDLEGLAPKIIEIIESDESLNVKLSCVFDRDAYGRLRSNDFKNGRPARLPHVHDAANWNAFVRAVNFIHSQRGFKGEGFPDLVEDFDNWVLYNRTAIDSERSTKPPNRTHIGNANVQSTWPRRWIGVSERVHMFRYLDAGRRFMNLCDGLKRLASEVDAVDTDETYQKLLNDLDELLKEDLEVSFAKSILLALFERIGGQVFDVRGPMEGEEIEDTFEVSLRVGAPEDAREA